MKKRILSLVLSAALVVTAMVNPMISYATSGETGAPTEMKIDDYRKTTDENGNYTEVPKAPEGYIFGGWYTTSNCDEAIATDKTTGNAWAKWVDKDVLSVKYQISADTTSWSEMTNLRLVTSVDSEQYRKVGFVINDGTKDSKPAMSDTVYQSIKGKVNGVDQYYYPNQEFDSTSKYFMVYEVSAVPNSVFATNLTIKPVWITLDGTTVTGSTNSFAINGAVAKESVAIENPNGGNRVSHNIYGVSAGDVLSFELDFNVDEALSVWVLGNGNKQYFASAYKNWTYGKQSIMVVVPNNLDYTLNYVQVLIQYNASDVDYVDKVATISNVKTDGNITVQNVKNQQNVYAYIGGHMAAGSTLSFDIELPTAENVSLWVLGQSSWDNEWYTNSIKPLSGKQTIEVTFAKTVENMKIQLQYQNADGTYNDNMPIISNVQINNHVNVENPNGGNRVSHNIYGVSAGQVLSFELDFNVNEALSVWVLGNGNKQYFASAYKHWQSGKQSIMVVIPEQLDYTLKYAQVLIQYNASSVAYTDKVATISNVQIDANVIVQNDENQQNVYAYIGGNMAAGSTLSFDIELPTAENVSLWVLGQSSWDNEWYTNSIKPLSGKQTIEVTFAKTVENMKIQLQYQNADGTYNDNMPIISNVTIE